LVQQPSASAAAPRYARPFVALFLVMLVACPLAAVNAWPFSSWRLFSVLRTANQSGWEAVAVDTAGRERDYPLGSVQHGYRGFGRVMSGFSKRSAAGRDEICSAWVQGARKRFGPSTALVRVYYLRSLLSDRHGHRAAPPRRTLEWICTLEGAHVPG
jgi:hypothetical protein